MMKEVDWITRWLEDESNIDAEPQPQLQHTEASEDKVSEPNGSQLDRTKVACASTGLVQAIQRRLDTATEAVASSCKQ